MAVVAEAAAGTAAAQNRVDVVDGLRTVRDLNRGGRTVSAGAEGVESRRGAGNVGSKSMGGKSEGTFRHQSELPRLAVPPLEETLDRYLKAVAPLLSEEAFSRTQAVVEVVRRGGHGFYFSLCLPCLLPEVVTALSAVLNEVASQVYTQQ